VVDPTGVGEDLLLPSRIEQVVPNPFNPQTIITYTVTRRGSVRLQLYDARGRRVRTLLAGEQDAGRHRIVWDGRSDRGAPLPSGVYCCRLVAGEVTRLAKLTLVR
jgi:flagellar hook assembly protein FlgD